MMDTDLSNAFAIILNNELIMLDKTEFYMQARHHVGDPGSV